MTTEPKSRVLDILDEITSHGYLEDRMEYDEVMLASTYALTDEEAHNLYILIQHGTRTDSLDKVPPEVIKEYIDESFHQGWDGFNRQQIETIELLMADLMQYNRNRSK